MKLRVLFLCATNGVQSPMAEALLTLLDADHFEAALLVGGHVVIGLVDPRQIFGV